MSYFVTPAEMQAATAPASRFLTGTGSPEGVVAAPVGTTYTDTAVTAGALEWTKFTGTGTTGWRVTKGETGVRQAITLLENGWVTVATTNRGIYVSRTPHLVTVDAYVHFTSATAVAVMTLPPGLRPAKFAYGTFMATNGGGDSTPAHITPDGVVSIPYAFTFSTKVGYLSLHFRPVVGTWPTTLLPAA